MTVNNASLANLKHYEGKWKHGQTRTIRVPITLADATLEYARQLDSGTKSLDTSDSNNEVEWLKDEVERLKNELEACRQQQPSPEIELPEAAGLLNRLKAKRKKSIASLADVEAILEMIEG